MVDENETTQPRFSVGSLNPVGAITDYSNGRGTSAEIKSKPLEQSYFINRSIPIYGRVFWRALPSTAYAIPDSLNQNTGVETEWMKIRVELFVGTTRVGGDDFPYSPVSYGRADEWTPLALRFRSEATVLEKGQELKMRITRFGGLTDLEISTADPYRSFVEIRYFTHDVYKGPIEILPNGVVRLPPPDQIAEEEREESQMAAFGIGGAFGVPVLAFLLGPTFSRRQRIALLFVCIFALAGLSGCLGSKGSSRTDDRLPPSSSEAPVSTETVENETLREQGVGTIRGRVSDYDNNRRLPGVRISLLGTPNSAVTGSTGRYDLGTVVAGTYKIRFDHEEYQFVERPVVVTLGRILYFNVSLIPLTADDGRVAHVHNEFLDADYVDIPAFNVGTSGTQGLSTCATSAEACETPFTLPVGKYVLPGTAVIEMELDWPRTPSTVQEMELTMRTAAGTEARLVARGPKDPFRLALHPNEPDPGHSLMTYWSFRLKVHERPYAFALFDDQWVGEMPTVSVKVRMIRGAIPYEPKHRDFWGADDRKTVFNLAALTYQGTVNLPNATFRFDPAQNVFIPPGTKELRGELTWSQEYTLLNNPVPIPLNAVEWGLVYKPANVPISKWRDGLKPVKVESTSANKITFTITPTAAEVDQYYQRASNWRFYLSDNLNRENVEGYSTHFKLTLVAIKQ